MKKLLVLCAALLLFPALAFAQARCTTGFPGTTPTDCTFAWTTPTVDATNIASFQLYVDGGTVPIVVPLSGTTKTTTAGIDSWTWVASTAVRILPQGIHTATIQACGATVSPDTCSGQSNVTNPGFRPVLTTPRITGVQ